MTFELAESEPIDKQLLKIRSSALDSPAHLLNISDDWSSLQAGIKRLRENDFAISCVASDQQALQEAFNKKPDLILLDLTVPTSNGLELLRELKCNEFTRAIPVLLICQNYDVLTKVHGFELGASDCITTPIVPAELVSRSLAQIKYHRDLALLKLKLVAYEHRYGSLNEEPELRPQNDLTRQEILRVHRARQVLREHLANPPSLASLAQSLGTNQPRLSRDFRKMYGTSVFAFIRELRLQRARDLLMNTSMRVKSVAMEVGYRNTSDLSRGIKEHFGISPTELRKNCVDSNSALAQEALA